jgi:hypothetical protein
MDRLDAEILNLFQFPLKERNQLIDLLFYDVGALTPAERSMLSPLVDLKGTIVVVSPQGAGRAIRHYKTALRFMLKEGDRVQAIAVAGVGSSVLGTAALARTIADFYGIDVAGIVTGYGMIDVVAEALGGWFFYGTMDRFRHAAESAAEKLLTPLPEARFTPPDAEDLDQFTLTLDFPVIEGGNSDVWTLLDILIARPKNLRLLLGHSKGDLLISFVLNRMVDELEGEHHPLYDELAVVTLGAVVSLPAPFARQVQFLGQLDWFGAINSELDVPHLTVPGAWHHLNPRLPFAMRLSEVLREVPLPDPAKEKGGDRSPIHSWHTWSPTTESQSPTPATRA